MNKCLTVVVLLSLVLAVTSESDESKRANSCGARAANGGKCRSNVSFIKRMYDQYKRGQVDRDTPRERGWELLEAERRADDLETVEEKLRLLKEILNELELYDDDMK